MTVSGCGRFLVELRHVDELPARGEQRVTIAARRTAVELIGGGALVGFCVYAMPASTASSSAVAGLQLERRSRRATSGSAARRQRRQERKVLRVADRFRMPPAAETRSALRLRGSDGDRTAIANDFILDRYQRAARDADPPSTPRSRTATTGARRRRWRPRSAAAGHTARRNRSRRATTISA